MKRPMTQGEVRRITPGDLTEIITFQSEMRTGDGYGGFTNAWVDVGQEYSSVEALFVGERDSRGAQRNVTQYRFTIYASDAYDEQMRIVWGGKTHNIRGIRKGEARMLFMDIITETGAGD